MNKKTLLLTGTTGFIGYNFLSYALSKHYYVIDIVRIKNKKNPKLKKLKNKYKKKYKSIYIVKNTDLQKKLKKIKIDYYINFATLYKNYHSYNDIFGFIDSNILFPTLVHDLISKKVKKIINFGTMMQHSLGQKLDSKNLYAATKNAFEMISNFYSYNEKKVKFYNLKFYESFGENDNRKKLIPIILENYKKNRTTQIISKNLELNIIHVNDIINAIMIIIHNDLESGSYFLRNNSNIKIKQLIKTLNKNLEKKIKVRYLKKPVNKIKKLNLRKLPKWKPKDNLVKKILLCFKK